MWYLSTYQRPITGSKGWTEHQISKPNIFSAKHLNGRQVIFLTIFSFFHPRRWFPSSSLCRWEMLLRTHNVHLLRKPENCRSILVIFQIQKKCKIRQTYTAQSEKKRRKYYLFCLESCLIFKTLTQPAESLLFIFPGWKQKRWRNLSW